MTSEVFFVPGKVEADDGLFAIAGRALALATRFEGLCRSLNLLLGLRTSSESILDSEERLRAFADEMRRKNLHGQVGLLAQQFDHAIDLFPILDEARTARNAIAHDLTASFESWREYPESRDAFLDALQPAVRALARADWLLSILAAVATNEERPPGVFLREYPERLVAWVLGNTDADPT